jgi:hypothetical protein
MDKCKHRKYFRDPNQAAKLQATTKSSLIECSYFLRATTEFNNCLCCSGLPTIDIPVIIYIPEIYGDINSIRPQNWNPQVMPTYQINVPNAEQLGINNGFSANYDQNSGYNSGMNVNPGVNLNMNIQVPQNNGQSTGMITSAYEPIQTNNTGIMMTNGTEPQQNF